VRIPGIVISASMTIAKATRLHLMCRSCQNTIHVNVKPGLNGLQLPRICDGQKGDANQNQAQCPLDPFLIVPDTRFVAPFPLKCVISKTLNPVLMCLLASVSTSKPSRSRRPRIWSPSESCPVTCSPQWTGPPSLLVHPFLLFIFC